MRTLALSVAAIVLAASLSPGTEARAQSSGVAALAGHWRCTLAGGRSAERSYFLARPMRGRGTERELFGRQDTTEPDGTPVASFERIAESTGGGTTVQAVEGTGTAAGASPLRFSGRSFDDDTTFSLTYAVSGDLLARTATRGAKTIDDERCTREPEPPANASCDKPNVRATTLHAEEPSYPAEAVASRAQGVVQVRVVLDDQSRVLWADVVKSASPLLSDEAVRAARASVYHTEIRNCRPISAEYIFTVEFSWR